MSQIGRVRSLLPLFWAVAALAAAPPAFHVYVGALDAGSVTLAWGTATGRTGNTIGYGAPSLEAVVSIGGREVHSSRGWVRVDGLRPDTVYSYQVTARGQAPVSGSVRTWPDRADRLVFFVMGDFGNASEMQYRIAGRLEEERRRLEANGTPVRFLMTTGDNIYASGSQDRDWEKRFYTPYRETLAAIPFYAVLGNHDGNESEKSTDLAVYLDNFFFPGGTPARWYHFTFGGLAEFFALDSTTNQLSGRPSPAYAPGGEQSQWLEKTLAGPRLPWRIAVLHHPLFTAGPDHPPALPKLEHWLRAWRDGGVSAVFAGHEHNLQFSERSEATGGMQFFVAGAGGELRRGNVRRRMAERHIAAWAPQNHFLVVEIDRDTMRVTPVGETPVVPRNAQGEAVPLPWVTPRRR